MRPSPQPLTLDWADNILTLRGERIPTGRLDIWYLEAYCRPNSTDAPWDQTTIGHTTRLVERSADGTRLALRCVLNDGVMVDHLVTATHDRVDFHLTAYNPTDRQSLAHWAQPCIRVGGFTGLDAERTDDPYAYIGRCFVFQNGRLQFMPTSDWATGARYTPGQVWAAPGVPRDDVNPRPLNPHSPDNGLIGCVSADGRMLMATAWEPYQELFQGVIRCIHSDFRIGGLEAGERKTIRGVIYIVANGVEALTARFRDDFDR